MFSLFSFIINFIQKKIDNVKNKFFPKKSMLDVMFSNLSINDIEKSKEITNDNDNDNDIEEEIDFISKKEDIKFDKDNNFVTKDQKIDKSNFSTLNYL
jgi:hypothetical protein